VIAVLWRRPGTGKTIAMFGRFAVFALARAGILGFGLLLFAADFTTFIIAVGLFMLPLGA
jgi:hypothetical protein